MVITRSQGATPWSSRHPWGDGRLVPAALSSKTGFASANANLREYQRLLEGLAHPTTDGTLPVSPNVEHNLRTTGARAIEDATLLMDEERLNMHTMIRASRFAALAALVVVVMILAFIASKLARQILGPLGRFVRYTQRIASGDYSPILPARRYKDEFSDLALAINRMLGQIQDHQAQLARSSRMAAVGTLTAGIAHELNNPLNNISLTTEALLERLDDCTREEQGTMLEDIFTQVDRASATVRNLLDFTRVEQTAPVSVRVADLVQDCARLLANEATLAGVSFDVELPDDLPVLQGVPSDLQQVFLNLFLNAIQAMPQGGTLSIHGRREPPEQVCVEVTDSGVGIPPEQLASIFDPFFTTKEVGHGCSCCEASPRRACGRPLPPTWTWQAFYPAPRARWS